MPNVNTNNDEAGAVALPNIKPWKERLFDDQPKLKGQYPNDDSGALDELGIYYAHAEIEDLRAALAAALAK